MTDILAFFADLRAYCGDANLRATPVLSSHYVLMLLELIEDTGAADQVAQGR